MAVEKYTKPVQESQVKNYPKIDSGKLCRQSTVFGYSGKQSQICFWFVVHQVEWTNLCYSQYSKCLQPFGYGYDRWW